MATITTRAGKGSALTFTEMDTNFTNLNTDKLETSGGTVTGNISFAAGKTVTIGNTYTFPTTDGSANQVLQTNGSGVLSFATVSGASGDITSVVAGAGMTGGATTGDATLNVIGGTGITANADDIELDFTAVTELTSGLASTDELVLNDAGVLKRMDISVLSAYTASLTETLTNKTIGAATLSGTLDVKNNTIESSNANVTIQANSTDKEIQLKVKDAGATLQTAAEFRDYAYNEQVPAGSGDSWAAAGGITAGKYATVVDLNKGIRVGSTANEFSATGAAPDNSTGAYNLSGIIVGNTNNSWPALEVIANGESDGENPLYNRYASSSLQNFPNGQFNFKASWGTAASPSAILDTNGSSRMRMGQINWYGHDGTGYGGSSDAAPSATITASANESFTTDTRGGKVLFDVLPSGQSGGTGTGSGDRVAILQYTGSELVINSGNKDVDLRVHGDTNDDILKVDGANEIVSTGGVFQLYSASSDPSSNLANGQMYYNTSTHKFRGYANGAWTDLH